MDKKKGITEKIGKPEIDGDGPRQDREEEAGAEPDAESTRDLEVKTAAPELGAAEPAQDREEEDGNADVNPAETAEAKDEGHRGYLPSGTMLHQEYLCIKFTGYDRNFAEYMGSDLNGDRVTIREYFPPYAQRVAKDIQADEKGPALAAVCEAFYQAQKRLEAVDCGCLQKGTCFLENGTVYYVTAPPGQSLFESAGSLPFAAKDIATTLLPVLDCVAKMHAMGIASIGIAPRTLYRDGDAWSLLEFDLLCEKLREGQEDGAPPEPGFAAPELYDPNGSIGPFTDIYAIAATLYYMLTASAPISAPERSGENAFEITDIPGFAIPIGIAAALQKGLSMRAEDRFESIAEFKNALLSNGRTREGRAMAKRPAAAPAQSMPLSLVPEDEDLPPLLPEQAIKRKPLFQSTKPLFAGRKLPIAIGSVVLSLALIIGFLLVGLPLIRYNKAVALLKNKQYDQARAAFTQLGDYADSKAMVKETEYQNAIDFLQSKQYDKALALLKDIPGYKDADDLLLSGIADGILDLLSADPIDAAAIDKAKAWNDAYGQIQGAQVKIDEAIGNKVRDLLSAGKTNEAYALLQAMGAGRTDSTIYLDAFYNTGVAFMNAGNYTTALEVFGIIPTYKDSDVQQQECKYNIAKGLIKTDSKQAAVLFNELIPYKDSKKQLTKIYTSARCFKEVTFKGVNVQYVGYDYYYGNKYSVTFQMENDTPFALTGGVNFIFSDSYGFTYTHYCSLSSHTEAGTVSTWTFTITAYGSYDAYSIKNASGNSGLHLYLP